jgi:hypothetical protein
MTSALPGQARAPGAAETERVRREVARPGWRLDTPAGVPAQRVSPAGLRYALTAAFSWFRPAAGIEPPHAGRADGGFRFDPLPGDLAGHAGKATARSTARNAERPPAHARLPGSPWPWRPATLFDLTVAAASGVALLPAPAARRHRP